MAVQLSPPPNGHSSPTPTSEVPHLLVELTRLLETLPEPAAFFGEFLHKALPELKAAGGALWGIKEAKLDLLYQVDLAALELDQIDNGWSCHAELIQAAVQKNSALLVPARSGPTLMGEKVLGGNPTRYALVLAPVEVEQRVVGVLEVWLPTPRDAATRRHLVRLVTEMAGFVAAFLFKLECRALRQQQRLWTQLEAFSRQVHSSLQLGVVAPLVASGARDLAECDQVSVATRLNGTTKVEAVSGAPTLATSSRYLEALRALFDAVLAWGEKLVFQGAADDSLPPTVRAALDGYLAESNSRALVLLPLREPGQAEGDTDCQFGLLADCFEKADDVQAVVQRLGVVGGHAAPALANALCYHRLPWKKATSWLAGPRRGGWHKFWLRAGMVAAAVFLVVGSLTAIRIPLRMEGKGQLLPRDRQTVFAPTNGKIVELKAQHGDWVEKGQELLFLEDLETQLQVDQLTLKIAFAEQRLALLNQQQGKSLSSDDKLALTRERIQQEFELRKALAEREILLHASRDPRKAPVRAPLSGKVVTFDPHEQLHGKTVKPGEPLLRIARTAGPWEIELFLPESAVGPVREALPDAPDGLEVDLLLTSHPHQTFKGLLLRTGLGGETTTRDNAAVLPVRVQIADRQLLTQLEAMPVGVEVRARIHCGRHPAGYVWFFDLWEFLHEHLLF